MWKFEMMSHRPATAILPPFVINFFRVSMMQLFHRQWFEWGAKTGSRGGQCLCGLWKALRLSLCPAGWGLIPVYIAHTGLYSELFR